MRYLVILAFFIILLGCNNKEKELGLDSEKKHKDLRSNRNKRLQNVKPRVRGYKVTKTKPGLHVKIQVIEPTDKSPETTLDLQVDSQGDLYDIDSHPIDEKGWKGVMRGRVKGKARFIRLWFSNEEKTSLATLSHVLEKMKSYAGPGQQTSIFLVFKSD